jgi:hypothetical protein
MLQARQKQDKGQNDAERRVQKKKEKAPGFRGFSGRTEVQNAVAISRTDYGFGAGAVAGLAGAGFGVAAAALAG